MKLSHVRTSVPCDRCLAPPWGSGLVPFLSTSEVMKAIASARLGALLPFRARIAKATTAYLAAIMQLVVDAVAEALSSEKNDKRKLQRTERALRERQATNEHDKWEALIDELVGVEFCDLDDVPAGALDWARA